MAKKVVKAVIAEVADGSVEARCSSCRRLVALVVDDAVETVHKTFFVRIVLTHGGLVEITCMGGRGCPPVTIAYGDLAEWS